MYDFVVVGAGPAGSRFARRTAEAGRDVLVLERGVVGEPLACSGHVSADIWAFVPQGAREELLTNEIRGADFHIGGPGSRGHRFYTDGTISYVIDRVGLDRVLADAAREAGADLREGHSVLSVTERGDHVAVEVRTPQGTRTIKARMVAGCDGPVSTVRRECGLSDPGEKLQGLLGFSEETEPEEFVDVHLSVPSFFAWRIPRGKAGTEYGLAAPPGENGRERFEDFVSAYDTTVGDVHAGMIPIEPPDRVTGKRSLLIGDAAAQTKPFTGGGLVYGMSAADHAARTVDPRDPSTLAEYEQAWRSDLSTEIELGTWIRRAYSLPNPIQATGLRTLAGKIDVHMDKPTSALSLTQLRAFLSRS